MAEDDSSDGSNDTDDKEDEIESDMQASILELVDFLDDNGILLSDKHDSKGLINIQAYGKRYGIFLVTLNKGVQQKYELRIAEYSCKNGKMKQSLICRFTISASIINSGLSLAIHKEYSELIQELLNTCRSSEVATMVDTTNIFINNIRAGKIPPGFRYMGEDQLITNPSSAIRLEVATALAGQIQKNNHKPN